MPKVPRTPTKPITFPLTEAQLNALDRLEKLAAEKLAELRASRPAEGSFHDDEIMLLSYVPNWLFHVRTGHENPYVQRSLTGILDNLRDVARHFKFDLS